MIEYRLHVIGRYLAKHNADIEEMFLPAFLSENQKTRQKALKDPTFSELRKALARPFLDPIAQAVADILGQSYSEARVGLLRQVSEDVAQIPGDRSWKVTALHSFEPFLAAWMALNAAKQSLSVTREKIMPRIFGSGLGAESMEFAKRIDSAIPLSQDIVDRALGFFYDFEFAERKMVSDADKASIAMGRPSADTMGYMEGLYWLDSMSINISRCAYGAVNSLRSAIATVYQVGDYIHCYQIREASRRAKRPCNVVSVSDAVNSSFSVLESGDICINDEAYRVDKEGSFRWMQSLHRSVWNAGFGAIEAYPPTPVRLSSGALSKNSVVGIAAMGALIGGAAVFASSRAAR